MLPPPAILSPPLSPQVSAATAHCGVTVVPPAVTDSPLGGVHLRAVLMWERAVMWSTDAWIVSPWSFGAGFYKDPVMLCVLPP